MAGTGNPELDREVQKIQERLQYALSAASQLSELKGEAQNKDGHVRVVIESTGMLSELEINPRAMKLGSAALAEEIKATVVAAQTDLSQRSQELMQPLMGDIGRLQQARSSGALQEVADDLLNGPAAVSRSSDPVAEAVRQFQRVREMMGLE
ncbi:YbaB/EbfC family nucleoid-associated protein [Actinoallomurus sp. NPDC052308]|uniref:YbaB/EbfC family nucleoid-associated protein n=1 Tax=Actinoallomurus sp. NPDC052308 TaxID=3155530 RepID=UPI0034385A3B